MDEPCSALDPIATLKIEELIHELKERYTIVIVTHNMQQAARVADTTAFFLLGELIEHAADRQDLHEPDGQAHRGVRHREVRVARHGYGRSAPALPARSSSASRSQALGGLDMVIEQLDRALEALEHQDVELATMVIADDDRIDGRYLEVHQGILSLLALQAPVAGDLRLVAALLHVIKHVERMGDQCVNIAKLIPLSGHEPPVRAEILALLAAHGRARALGGRAGASPPSPARDVDLAEDLVRQDDEINRLNREIFRLALEIGDDADMREWAMHMIMVARALERIGDNAVDIGEQTAFVVTGLFREFSDSSAPTVQL